MKKGCRATVSARGYAKSVWGEGPVVLRAPQTRRAETANDYLGGVSVAHAYKRHTPLRRAATAHNCQLNSVSMRIHKCRQFERTF